MMVMFFFLIIIIIIVVMVMMFIIFFIIIIIIIMVIQRPRPHNSCNVVTVHATSKRFHFLNTINIPQHFANTVATNGINAALGHSHSVQPARHGAHSRAAQLSIYRGVYLMHAFGIHFSVQLVHGRHAGAAAAIQRARVLQGEHGGALKGGHCSGGAAQMHPDGGCGEV
jgi:hypothetical protein